MIKLLVFVLFFVVIIAAALTYQVAAGGRDASGHLRIGPYALAGDRGWIDTRLPPGCVWEQEYYSRSCTPAQAALVPDTADVDTSLIVAGIGLAIILSMIAAITLFLWLWRVRWSVRR